MVECKLRVSRNRVLRNIFGHIWEEVTGGGWRKQHNQELHCLYSSAVVISLSFQEG
jgi:hypothetical protein